MNFDPITHAIIGASMRVHSSLGNGFQEVIYQRALKIELSTLNINFQREAEIPIFYRGLSIGSRRVDFLVEEKIPVEIKATTFLDNNHLAQAKNYLEALNLEVGLLINFGSTRLIYKRLHNTQFNNKQLNHDGQD